MTKPATADTPRGNGLHVLEEIRDIRDLVSYQLSRAAALSDRTAQNWSMRDFGLRLNEWRVLALSEALKPASFGAIARELSMDKGQLSRILKTLTERELVITAPYPHDQRTIGVELTEAGRDVYEQIFAISILANRAYLEEAGEEDAMTLMRLLRNASNEIRDMTEGED